MTWETSSRDRAEHHCLPETPKAKLDRSVRRHLRLYGITTNRWSEKWSLAWQWAYEIGRSYYHFHWPNASEIGAQYLLLVLAKMKNDRALRLPHRATQRAPAAVVAKLGGEAPLAISFAQGK